MIPGWNMTSSTGRNWRPLQSVCVIKLLLVNCHCRLWLPSTSGRSWLYLCSFTSTNNTATAAAAAGFITLPLSHMADVNAVMLQCTQIQPYQTSDTSEMWLLFQIWPKFHSSYQWILARFQILAEFSKVTETDVTEIFLLYYFQINPLIHY